MEKVRPCFGQPSDRGRLKNRTEQSECIADKLSLAQFVGAEISLLTGWRRMASVRAATHCSLFSLSAENFHNLLERYPVVRRTLESVD